MLVAKRQQVYMGPYCAEPGGDAVVFLNLLMGKYGSVALSAGVAA